MLMGRLHAVFETTAASLRMGSLQPQQADNHCINVAIFRPISNDAHPPSYPRPNIAKEGDGGWSAMSPTFEVVSSSRSESHRL